MSSLKKKVLLLELINENITDLQIVLLILTLMENQTDWSLILPFFEQEIHMRSPFTEEWLNQYVEWDFFMLFRMNRETFSSLLDTVMCEQFAFYFSQHHNSITPRKALLMTLWWLGKGEVLNSVADKFDVAVSTVYHYSEITIKRLCELQNIYIKWPHDPNDINIIEQQFYGICGFPGVIGAIDGCNVKIKAKADQQDSYIDKNGNHSIKLQAVATAKKILININVGFGGSVHDARVFRNSSLYRDIQEQGNIATYFPSADYHLVGDKAYPLLPWLMTPYKNIGHLDRSKSTYNTKHSKTRIKIEHCFGTLKPRFRIMNYINVNNPIKATKIITACCVLHNFCYLNSDEWPENSEDFNIEDMAVDQFDDMGIPENNRASVKRNTISHLFDIL